MAGTASPMPQRVRRASILTLAGAVASASLITSLASAPAFAEASSACSLYASTSGSDSNSGTPSAPFLTVKHLIQELSAGQTGCVASGQTFSGFTLYNGDSHGAEGAPVTVTSTNPSEPATIDTRITAEAGADWLTFSHLTLKIDATAGEDELPSPTIGSAHTTWSYDDVSGGDVGICFSPIAPGPWGVGEYTLIEHDRVHDCGHPVTKAELEAQANDIFCEAYCRLNGWHAHGLYDEGQHTTVRNSYFYDNSGVGVLLRAGSYAVIEHNIIDHNGRGVEFADEGPNHDIVAWNIVTNSTSPCGNEVGVVPYCDTYGVQTFCLDTCFADTFRNNDLFGNEAGSIGYVSAGITLEANTEVDPLYVNAAAHEYTLQAGSPAVGYGPDTAQPAATLPTETTPPKQSRPGHTRHSAIAATLRPHRVGHRHAKRARAHRHAKRARAHRHVKKPQRPRRHLRRAESSRARRLLRASRRRR
jgi:Right handed beta helix region